LDQYASVSNAKFNQDKTECFSLNGSPDDGWQQLLDDHHITTFATRNLSIQGRTTIANSLLLPKLWYSLRLFHAPQKFIGSLRTMLAGLYLATTPSSTLLCSSMSTEDRRRSWLARPRCRIRQNQAVEFVKRVCV
jgi:hypothetical protein